MGQKTFFVFPALIGVLLASQSVFAGNWSSGGGDQHRFYFEEGRPIASFILRNLDADSFDANVDPQIRDWLLQNHEKMADDLLKTEFIWTDVPQPTCASTQFFAGAPIQLSFSSCLSITSKEEAAKLLTHETVHHMGIGNKPQEETFADRVAIAAFTAWENIKLKSVPLCEDAKNVIASVIFGDWQINRELSARLGGAMIGTDTVSFRKDLSVISKIPPFGGCAITAGYFEYTKPYGTMKNIFVLTLSKGNPVIRYLRIIDGQLNLKAQFNNIGVSKAKKTENEILMFGGDHLEEPFTIYFRK